MKGGPTNYLPRTQQMNNDFSSPMEQNYPLRKAQTRSTADYFNKNSTQILEVQQQKHNDQNIIFQIQSNPSKPSKTGYKDRLKHWV